MPDETLPPDPIRAARDEVARPGVRPADTKAPGERAGDLIDRYKLLEQIGEGGMGTVWMAEQKEPVKRRVALKIIKLGMDTKQVVARFEAERQALAMMDHPHIAKVLDAGATSTGRPYFVMEYIKGIPILEYCDHDKVDTKARLLLFTSVCHAIQHAHQKGIIHRDIKPTNVLVTMHDGVPVTKVIDFGIAKATNSELTTKTLFTEHRQMVGTPAYMSPEQAEMSGLDIDTRSDIYSLGVLLYELLTGTTPFDIKDLMAKGFAEMMRTIREVEPHKPSTRISSLGDTGTRTALERRVDVKKLGTLLRGDLDWIVMKCLEKDRTRRYETANGLADDIKRHLANEPVSAGAPSAGYRLRKFVRRNRAQVVAGGLVAATLVFGVVGTTLGMIRARDEAERAEIEKGKATLAAANEAAAKTKAQESEQLAIAEATAAKAAKDEEAKARKRVETISEFVTEALKSGDAENEGGGQTTTILQAMDRAVADITAGRFRDDPATEAGLQLTIAGILENNGRSRAAETMARSALATIRQLLPGGSDTEILGLRRIASALHTMGRAGDAVHPAEGALDVARKLHTSDHPQVVKALNDLAVPYRDLGRLVDADALLVEALEMQQRLDEDDGDLARILDNLARVRAALGDLVAAEELQDRALTMRRRIYDGDHPDLMVGLLSLANARRLLGRKSEADQLFIEALDIARRLFPGDHPHAAAALLNLGSWRRDSGDLVASAAMFAEAVAMYRRLVRDGDPQTAFALSLYGAVLIAQNRFAEGQDALAEAVAMLERLHVGGSESAANVATGSTSTAEPLVVRAIEVLRRSGRHDHAAALLGPLGTSMLALGRPADAQRAYQELLALHRRQHHGDHADLAWALHALGAAHQTLGENDEARAVLDESLAMLQRVEPAGSTTQARVLWRLGTLDLAAGNPAAAAPQLEEAVAMAERCKEPDASRLAAYRETLAKCTSALRGPGK